VFWVGGSGKPRIVINVRLYGGVAGVWFREPVAEGGPAIISQGGGNRRKGSLQSGFAGPYPGQAPDWASRGSLPKANYFFCLSFLMRASASAEREGEREDILRKSFLAPFRSPESARRRPRSS